MTKPFVRTLSRTVDNAVLLTLLVALIFAAYALWDTHQMLNAADAAQYTEYKPTNEESKSFEELRAMNNDVIGWLTGQVMKESKGKANPKIAARLVNEKLAAL